MSNQVMLRESEPQNTGRDAVHVQISVPLLLSMGCYPELLVQTVTSPSPYWVLILCLAILRSPRIELLLRLAGDQTGVGWLQSSASAWSTFTKLRRLLRRPELKQE